ncbi:transposable element Tc1 transposase [Trichonephila clavata]|uniref:Transposable element Tc1 transposase n=1 Tax=Trichonephila clavata TaxID=2740835 RepID=A0A8X6H3D6_TRICU|nr:transposable element Tc1 transposase [Trichonephila clavata]
MESYRNRFTEIRVIYEKNYNKHDESKSEISSEIAPDNLKLPKLSLKKYDLIPRSWIAFWSQFCRVHEDKNLREKDKFQCLLYSLKRKPTARNIAESYPSSKGNYLKLTDLYDKLGSYLRALETLNVATSNYASRLYPVVESCLPAEVLKALDRHRLNREVPEDLALEKEKVLENLMTFLRHEAEGEEHRILAENGFGSKTNRTESHKQVQQDKERTKVYLKTIMIILCHKSKEMCVRGLLDDGSHRSYVGKDLIEELRLCPSSKGTFSKGLFGGGISPAAEHGRYTVKVESLHRKYPTKMSLFDQPKICSMLPRIRDESLLSDLASGGIKLTDIGKDTPPI